MALTFQPEKRDVGSVPLDVHNDVLQELEKAQDELVRCRQKVAHLLKEKESRWAT